MTPRMELFAKLSEAVDEAAELANKTGAPYFVYGDDNGIRVIPAGTPDPGMLIAAFDPEDELKAKAGTPDLATIVNKLADVVDESLDTLGDKCALAFDRATGRRDLANLLRVWLDLGKTEVAPGSEDAGTTARWYAKLRLLIDATFDAVDASAPPKTAGVFRIGRANPDVVSIDAPRPHSHLTLAEARKLRDQLDEALRGGN